MDKDSALRALIGAVERALDYERKAFEGNLPVNGGDLADWFANWRRNVKPILKEAKKAAK